jgi:hypothetical protein
MLKKWILMDDNLLDKGIETNKRSIERSLERTNTWYLKTFYGIFIIY